MNERILLVTFAVGSLLAFSGLVAGCESATCESACEQRNDCGGEPQVADCANFCATETKVAAATGCTDAYDARLSCIGTAKSCTAETFCAGQEAAYLSCVNDACAKDPDKCTGQGGSGGTSGTGAGGGGGS